jgi:hypothetical protein
MVAQLCEVARNQDFAGPFSDYINRPLDSDQKQSDQHRQSCRGGDHGDSFPLKYAGKTIRAFSGVVFYAVFFLADSVSWLD